MSKGAENANLQSATAFVSGDMTELPFRADTLDFAYSVNAFHHIDTMERKRAALAEVARVLKPGGLFFLHEMNVSNPLLRVYLSYVFPLVRSIDEGTEQWLDPRGLPDQDRMRLVNVHYFTFAPDFLPSGLLPAVRWIEARLESGPLRRYGVHYMAVYAKSESPGTAEARGGSSETVVRYASLQGGTETIR